MGSDLEASEAQGLANSEDGSISGTRPMGVGGTGHSLNSMEARIPENI